MTTAKSVRYMVLNLYVLYIFSNDFNVIFYSKHDYVTMTYKYHDA